MTRKTDQNTGQPFPEDPNTGGAKRTSREVRPDPLGQQVLDAATQELLGREIMKRIGPMVNTAILALELAQKVAKLPKNGELDRHDASRVLLDGATTATTLAEYHQCIDAARFLANPELEVKGV